MKDSKISWTDHTFNPWIGCTKVSEGCKNCYAAENFRFKQHFGPDAERHVTSENYWKQPLKWSKKAEAEGVRHKVFCGSMCDVFEIGEGLKLGNVRNRLGELIKWTPNLDWLLLTKRPENNRQVFCDMGLFRIGPEYGVPIVELPDNVWIGVSVENQEQADKRIPELLKIPAKVRFLSCEPLLGQIDLWRNLSGSVGSGEWDGKETYIEGIRWLIAGAESGSNRREMNLDHMISLHNQCMSSDIPFFCKQDSAQKPGQQGRIPDWLWNIKEFPSV